MREAGEYELNELNQRHVREKIARLLGGDSPAIHMQTDQKHAKHVRNINEGELGVPSPQENQDWTTRAHSADKEGKI